MEIGQSNTGAEILPFQSPHKIGGIPKRERHAFCLSFYREWLMKYCRCARKSIDIVNDTLNPLVFDPIVSHYLETALISTFLIIRIVTGPKILTRCSANNLCWLARFEDYEARISLRSFAISPENFTIIDEKYLYRELHSPVDDVSHEVEISEWDIPRVEMLHKHFEVLWNNPGSCYAYTEELPSTSNVVSLNRSL